jgi:hypothetical protein
MAASVWMKSSYCPNPKFASMQSANDPGGHCLTDLEWVSDREHEIADLKPICI